MTELVAHPVSHPELSALQANKDDQPDHAFLQILHKELNANTMSIPSVRGGGQHGHLSHTRTLSKAGAAYLAITNSIPFINPVHPCLATGVHTTEANPQYTTNLKDFQVFLSTKASLQKQLSSQLSLQFSLTNKARTL